MISNNQCALRMAHILYNNKPHFRWGDILRYGWYFVRFRKWLANGVIHFSYFKEDGSIREARGTLSVHLIPRDDAPKGTSTGKPNFGVINYYDIDKKDWRSFKITNFIGFVSGYSLTFMAPAQSRFDKQSEDVLEMLKESDKRK
jgi:hypothetical protein